MGAGGAAALFVAALATAACAKEGIDATGGAGGAGTAPVGGAAGSVGVGEDHPREEEVAAGRLAVEPGATGADLPPIGRSLFDFVTAGRVPFPFPALARRIARAAFGRPDESLVRGVLIPAGRSLQRAAAVGAPFDFPRAIIAVDRQPPPRARHDAAADRPLLDARLYVAYQEKAARLEVISYNEAAGRFEFQVVRDYAPGRRPVIEYARRALCTSCHQNGAAIFSRPLWNETNANGAVAARLHAHGARGSSGARRMYGIPVEQGVDVAYAIDDATDRANRLAALQIVWREGCGGDDQAGVLCRAELLRAVLAYRLADAGHLPEGATLRAANWRARLPGGLFLPSPDIPNRDPLEQPDIAPPFEPLLPRAPLEHWPLAAAAGAELARVVDGLGTMLSDDDVRWLDDALAAGRPRLRCAHQSGGGAGEPCCFAARCTARAEREATAQSGGARAGDISIDLTCEPLDVAGDVAAAGPRRLAFTGRIHLAARGAPRPPRGEIDALELEGRRELGQLVVATGAVRRHGGAIDVSVDLASVALGTRARRLDGRVLGPLEIMLAVEDAVWPPRAGGAASVLRARATLAVEGGDPIAERLVAPLVRAAEARAPAAHEAADTLSDRPFRRARLMQTLSAALGRSARHWCCADEAPGGPRALPLARAGPVVTPLLVAGASAPPLALLRRYCSECHDTDQRTPPNFLHGAPPAVAVQVSQCAERIAFRLAMWARPPETRARTPMPPPSALDRAGITPGRWPSHPDYAQLGARMGSLAGAPRDVPYGSLRPCLAGAP